VDEVGGPAVGEEVWPAEGLGVGRGDEQRVRYMPEGFRTARNRDRAGVASGAQCIGEPADVIEAVGGKVAVINEENVHAEKE
jgi:hypothetical protein